MELRELVVEEYGNRLFYFTIALYSFGLFQVLQIAGIIFFLFGMLGKVGAVFVLIPDPVIGGLFFVLFGMIIAVGLSNLQHVDLNASR